MGLCYSRLGIPIKAWLLHPQNLIRDRARKLSAGDIRSARHESWSLSLCCSILCLRWLRSRWPAQILLLGCRPLIQSAKVRHRGRRQQRWCRVSWILAFRSSLNMIVTTLNNGRGWMWPNGASAFLESWEEISGAFLTSCGAVYA